jgi:hypothetical protein
MSQTISHGEIVRAHGRAPLRVIYKNYKTQIKGENLISSPSLLINKGGFLYSVARLRLACGRIALQFSKVH